MGKILESTTPSAPSCPSPMFSACRRDSILAGCRLSAHRIPHITVAHPSNVAPPEVWALTLLEAIPSSHQARRYGRWGTQCENEFLVRGNVNYNCCLQILPLHYLLSFCNSPSSVHNSEASFTHSVPSHTLAHARSRVISDYCPPNFPSTPTAHLPHTTTLGHRQARQGSLQL